MAALPYIQLYVADYLADTMHLQAEEHGAYLLLIFNYWQTGKPIPKSRLQAITRISNERWTDVEQTLSEFFNDTGTHWQHDRIDEDLLRVSGKQSAASKAGKASAAARKAKKKAEQQRAANDRSTDVDSALERNGNHKDTDTDTDTDKKLPAKKFAEDDLKLAEFILDRVLQVAPKTKAPNLDKWADTIRLMREQDNLTLREIAEVFAWANRDSFWKTNILSPAKLRDKFSQLAAKMEAPTNAKPDKSDLEDQRMREYWESKRAGNHGNPAGAESVAGSPMLGWDQ